jgi:hypothetical protein
VHRYNLCGIGVMFFVRIPDDCLDWDNAKESFTARSAVGMDRDQVFQRVTTAYPISISSGLAWLITSTSEGIAS